MNVKYILAFIVFIMMMQPVMAEVVDPVTEITCDGHWCTATAYAINKYYKPQKEWVEIDENYKPSGAGNSCLTGYSWCALNIYGGHVDSNYDYVVKHQSKDSFGFMFHHLDFAQQSLEVNPKSMSIKGSEVTYDVDNNITYSLRYLPTRTVSTINILNRSVFDASKKVEDLTVWYEAPSGFDYELIEKGDWHYISVKKNGVELYRVDRVTVFDSGWQPIDYVDIELDMLGKTPYFKASPNMSLLLNETVSYPIHIDPSYVVDESPAWDGYVEYRFTSGIPPPIRRAWSRTSNPANILLIGRGHLCAFTVAYMYRTDLEFNLSAFNDTMNLDEINLNLTPAFQIPEIPSGPSQTLYKDLNVTFFKLFNDHFKYTDNNAGNSKFYDDMGNGTVYGSYKFNKSFPNITQVIAINTSSFLTDFSAYFGNGTDNFGIGLDSNDGKTCAPSHRALATDLYSTSYSNASRRPSLQITYWVNILPDVPSVELNSSLDTNLTSEDLHCFGTISDDDVDKMNVTVFWYNNSVLDFSIDYNNSYANGTTFNATLDSANTTVHDTWNCSLRLHDGFNSSIGYSNNLTIVDVAAPTVNILYPENTSYNYYVADMNYSVSDDYLAESCWYSINGGMSNSTPVNAGTNFTGLTSVEGSNTWDVWCNDTSNNIGNDEVTFVKDSIHPNINMTFPQNTTYTEDVTTLNYTVSDIIGLDSCWYSLNEGATNTSVNCGNNVTGLSAGAGNHKWTVYANDTLNNENSSAVEFVVILNVAPNVPDVFLNSTFETNLTTENLTCFGNITDNDVGDRLNVSVDWYKNQALDLTIDYNNSYVNDTFFTAYLDSANTTVHEVWNCSLRLHDGTASAIGYSDNLTIVDIIEPTINITFPEQIYYGFNVSAMNYTYSDDYQTEYCWYSLDNGTTNSTPVDAGTNFTSLTSVEVFNVWDVWCNDTSNNIGNDRAIFVKDTIAPDVNMTFPQNTTYFEDVVELNYTARDVQTLDSCWYSFNEGDTNTSISCGENITGLSAGEGSHIWTIYANDTLNNENSSAITFTVFINEAPEDPSTQINSTYGNNYDNETLNCFSNIYDPDANVMNVSVRWFRNDTLNLSFDFNNNYANGTFFTTNLTEENTTIGDRWICSLRLFDGELYSNWINSSELTIVEANVTIVNNTLFVGWHDIPRVQMGNTSDLLYVGYVGNTTVHMGDDNSTLELGWLERLTEVFIE